MKGLKIGEKHTYNDFGLKMLSFSGFSSPEVIEEYQEVPGRHGKLDLSESLTGEPVYKDRHFEAIFDIEEVNPVEFKRKIHNIENYLHGRVYHIIDDNEPDWFYEGRIKVSYARKNYRFYTVTISSDSVYPYKYKHNKTVVSVSVTGEAQELVLTNERMSVVPEFTCTGETTITFGNITHTMNAGTHIFADILLKQGENVLTVSGSGTLTVLYQEGAL